MNTPQISETEAIAARARWLTIPQNKDELCISLYHHMCFCTKVSLPHFNATAGQCVTLASLLQSKNGEDYAQSVRDWSAFWDQNMLHLIHNVSTAAELIARCETALGQVLHGRKKQPTAAEPTNEHQLSRFEENIYRFLTCICGLGLKESTNPISEFEQGAVNLGKLLLERYPDIDVAREELIKLWPRAKALTAAPFSVDTCQRDEIVLWLKDFYLNHTQGSRPYHFIGMDLAKPDGASGTSGQRNEVPLEESHTATSEDIVIPLTLESLQSFLRRGGRFPEGWLSGVPAAARWKCGERAVENLNTHLASMTAAMLGKDLSKLSWNITTTMREVLDVVDILHAAEHQSNKPA